MYVCLYVLEYTVGMLLTSYVAVPVAVAIETGTDYVHTYDNEDCSESHAIYQAQLLHTACLQSKYVRVE